MVSSKILKLSRETNQDKILEVLAGWDPSDVAEYLVYTYNTKPRRVTRVSGLVDSLITQTRSKSKVTRAPDVVVKTFKLTCYPEAIARVNRMSRGELRKCGKPGFPDFMLRMAAVSAEIRKIHDDSTDITDTGLVYRMPKGTKLYHGSQETRGKQKVFSDMLWLTLSPYVPAAYALVSPQMLSFVSSSIDRPHPPITRVRGDVYEFSTSHELRLFNITYENVLRLKKDYPDLIGILDLAFPTRDAKLGRESQLFVDYILAYYICSKLGLDGYIANRIGSFHSEIMLCKVHLSTPKVYTWGDDTIIGWIKDLNFVRSGDSVKLIRDKVETFLRFYCNSMSWPPS